MFAFEYWDNGAREWQDYGPDAEQSRYGYIRPRGIYESVKRIVCGDPNPAIQIGSLDGGAGVTLERAWMDAGRPVRFTIVGGNGWLNCRRCYVARG